MIDPPTVLCDRWQRYFNIWYAMPVNYQHGHLIQVSSRSSNVGIAERFRCTEAIVHLYRRFVMAFASAGSTSYRHHYLYRNSWPLKIQWFAHRGVMVGAHGNLVMTGTYLFIYDDDRVMKNLCHILAQLPLRQ